jgi:hypothetical protein
VIKSEKLTSTTALIKWNSVQFSQSAAAKPQQQQQPYYKLQYWLQSNPSAVVTHDRLNHTELHLRTLRPNSDYFVQIVAIQPNSAHTSEPALKHFKTLLVDLPAPGNTQLIRYEADDDEKSEPTDKCDLKWDAPAIVSTSIASSLKGYRIYYKETLVSKDVSYDDEDETDNESVDQHNDALDSGEEPWKFVDYDLNSLRVGMSESASNNRQRYEFTLSGLKRSRDYAVKIVALDHANNEGEESQVQYANRLTPPVGSGSTTIEVDDPYQPIDEEELTDLPSVAPGVIGPPRDLDVIEYTATSVKFGWMPPPVTAPGSVKIKHFLISYSDKPRQYRESNGSVLTHSKGPAMAIKVPARGDPTIRLTWLVTGLIPFTEYSFNVSALLSNDAQGTAAHKRIRTRPGKPYRVEQPQVIDIYTDNTVELKLGNASERHGPILKYWLVVVPIGYGGAASANKLGVVVNTNGLSDEQQQAMANYEARERDIASLVRYSLYNATFSNESAYIGAEFDTSEWPARFILGDGLRYGRFLNRKLTRGFDYKAYIVAFSAESQMGGVHGGVNGVNSASTTIQSNKQQNRASSVGNPSPNMLGLGDLLNAAQGGGAGPSGYIDSDLFSYSLNSKVFNTRYVDFFQI